MTQVIGGIIEVQVDGKSIDIAVGDVDVDIGEPMATEVLGGHGRMVGVKLEPRPPYISGERHVTNLQEHRELLRKRDATVTVRLPQGTVVLRNATYSAEGAVKSGEGKTAFKFVGRSAELL